MNESLVDAIHALEKAGRVKGHFRKTKSGKTSFVKDHFRKMHPTMHSLAVELHSDSGAYGSVPTNMKIPAKWAGKMKIAERAAAKIAGKTVGEVLGADIKKIKSVPGHMDVDPDSDALESLAIGEESEQKAIYKKLGKDGKVLNNVLNEMFDGELSHLVYPEGGGGDDD